jgi:DNA-binding NarL/FixJ family response regulator
MSALTLVTPYDAIPASAVERKRLLILETEPMMHTIIGNFLSRFYQVRVVSQPDEMIDALRFEKFDLALIDVQAGPAAGPHVAMIIAEAFPNQKMAFTAKNRLEEYFPLLHRSGVYNVLIKSTPFQFDQFLVSVENLLEPRRAVGLKRYLREPAEIKTLEVKTREDRVDVIESACAYFRRFRALDTDVTEIRLSMEELINNSLFHAFQKYDGTERYRAITFTHLSPSEQMVVEYGRDNSNLGISVSDNQGTLQPEVVFRHLARQQSDEGILDLSGRGFFLTRTLSDHLAITIRKGVLTQTVALFAHKRAHSPKPMSINVIP